DYDEGYAWNRGDRGAPVDADGNPIFYHTPKSYPDAHSDGERWRWMLSQAVEFDPSLRNEVDVLFADFLRQQFDVQTMAHAIRPFASNDSKDERAGIFAVST